VVVRIAGVYDRSSLAGRASSQLRFFVRTVLELRRREEITPPPELIVVVGSPALSTFVPSFACRRSSPRVIQWVYDLYPEAMLALRPRDLALRAGAGPARAALDSAWRSADAVVAISDAMAARIRQRAPRAKVQTIPLWAPDGAHPRADGAPALRRVRGIAEDAFVVMYHGNLGLAYDFEPLLDAANLLRGDSGIVFAIVGDGAQRQMLHERVGAEHLTNVRVFPSVSSEELSESLAMGDCHVVSVREGWDGLAFPSKLISGLAAGRPLLVIGPPSTELATVVRTNDCGMAVPIDGSAAAEAVRWLRDHRHSAREQGDRGRAVYERTFDRGKALAAWDMLADSIMVERQR
jgi:colanic acid biosynthesis glycosyl transferase WcaI